MNLARNNLKHAIDKVLNKEIGAFNEYRHLIKGKDAAKWIKGNGKEIHQLITTNIYPPPLDVN